MQMTKGLSSKIQTSYVVRELQTNAQNQLYRISRKLRVSEFFPNEEVAISFVAFLFGHGKFNYNKFTATGTGTTTQKHRQGGCSLRAVPRRDNHERKGYQHISSGLFIDRQ